MDRPDDLPDSFDPLEMALDADRSDPAPDSPARTLLRNQNQLIMADLKHRRLQINSERAGLGLKVLTGLAGLIAAGALAVMVWNAAHDRSLVITAFATPPDMAARGLGGQVIAAQLMDKLAAIDANAPSFRSAQTIRGDWGGDIKVEIPATGVSISELDRYLRSLLSHRTTIGGEVFDRAGGLTLTVRAGAAGARSVAGTEADLDGMLQKAAEAVFEQTQPFRYSKYLEFVGRRDEAMAAARRLAETGPDSEKPWAWAQISNLLEKTDMPGAAAAGRRAVELDPHQGLGYLNWSIGEGTQGHDELAYQTGRKSNALLASGQSGLSSTGVTVGRSNAAFGLGELGDYQGALARAQGLIAITDNYEGLGDFRNTQIAVALVGAHDLAAARAVTGVKSDSESAAQFGDQTDTPFQYVAAMEAGDWRAAEAAARSSVSTALARGDYLSLLGARTQFSVRLALALAEQGRFDEARAAVGPSGLDCAHCVTMRGQVETLAHNWTAADRWFAQAAAMTPSLPFAQLEWGRSLLMRGEPDAAIAHLAVAARQGPRFADVSELWGEALLRKGDSAGAAARFEKAAAITPHWGHNQIVWGQALAAQGKAGKAHERWATAGGLPLSPPDRTLLEHLLAGANH
jgi:tetratricopeptide (TPR) repeat protein